MKSKRTGKPVFFVVLILILALTYTAFFGIENYHGDTRNVYVKGANDIRWGIDIKGGVEAVFSPDKKNVKITSEDMDAAKAIIETRMVNQNITDYEVYTDTRNHQVIVRFPWAAGDGEQDAAAAVKELGETALLQFCEGTTQDTPILDGSKVKNAWVGSTQEGEIVVFLEFNEDGKVIFEDATTRLINQKISIWMDTMKISEPTVQSAISRTSNPYINGMSSAEEAKDLADKINAGSLPFALTVDDSKLQIISPSLGSDALRVMLVAASIAFGVVCLLMLLRYRMNGFVACISLLGQIAGTIACVSGYFSTVPSFTLTIPGIAGIILSVGMGVDCNVIAAERISEEFGNGKTIDGAIDAGYDNSFSAVLDGNVTIVIVSLVLMGAFGTPDSPIAKVFSPLMSLFGTSITGAIYSFGYTLLMGVIFNMIMGVFASKYMIKSISQLRFLRKPWLFGGMKNG